MSKPKLKLRYSPSKPLTVVVDRKRWGRGNPKNTALLCRFTDKQCCLGFACRAMGFSRGDILGEGNPSDLVEWNEYRSAPSLVIPGLTKAKEVDNTRICNALMKTNDTDKLSDSRRERRITELGKRIGLRFVFKG